MGICLMDLPRLVNKLEDIVMSPGEQLQEKGEGSTGRGRPERVGFQT